MTPADMVLSPGGLRYRSRRFPVTWGRNGITTQKREGDGCTPAGILQVIGTLYRPDRLARTAVPPWAMPIGLEDRWCDDPHDQRYNSLIRVPFKPSNERLRRADPLYDIILLTDWNWPAAIPFKGSAIFLHGWRRPGYPTAGCLGFCREDLIWIAQHALPGTRLIIPPLSTRVMHPHRSGFA